MSQKRFWKDKGYAGNSYSAAMPFLNSGHEHQLVNVITGEQRTIQVYSNQTLSQAITTDEQWTEDIETEDEHFSFETSI